MASNPLWAWLAYRDAMLDNKRSSRVRRSWSSQDLDVCCVLAQDEDQTLVETTHQQILLIDRSGVQLRCYHPSQRAEALKQWNKYR